MCAARIVQLNPTALPLNEPKNLGAPSISRSLGNGWETMKLHSFRINCARRATAQPRLSVDQLGYVQDEIRRYSGHATPPRNRIKRAAQCPMPCRKLLYLAKGFSGGGERLLELRAGLQPSLAQRHLHPALRIQRALAGGFHRQKDHLRKARHHRRLHPIRLRTRHAAERLQRQHHVAEALARCNRHSCPPPGGPRRRAPASDKRDAPAAPAPVARANAA